MRRIINWNDDWCFYKEKEKGLKISIPHTWNGIDGQDGGNDYKRITCKYTKKFNRPDMTGEDTCLVVFNGVNSEATVNINGKLVAYHEGGYSTFIADITPYLEEENLIEVEVSNEKNNRVYPQKADFTFYGGIYRDVELHLLNEKCFLYRENAAPSLKVTPTILDKNGIAYLSALVSKPCKVVYEVEDDKGEVVATAETEFTQSHQEKEIEVTINKVHLWNGIKDPYLYKVTAKMMDGENICDELSTNIGFRTFRADPQKGFFLNGKSYPLRGVCRHQDRPILGNAITKAEHDEDMELIREIGANTVRLAHYQHDQYFYDLCDKYGMVVWAEIPYISEHMPEGRENTISQMKELIAQNYNHPSIVTWGLSNEITISTKNTKDMLDNHRVLNDLCHDMDKTRFTTLACYAMCNPISKVVHLADVVSYNLYLGWYVPGFYLNDIFISTFHKRYPNRCLGYSEYGAEGMPNLHSENPKRGDNTEEYQAIYHEYMLKCFEKYPFMWATHVWNMFDFAADARNQGGEPGMNHKGLVTFDRKTKKDSFYLYQAYWTEKPMIHICSKRFEERNQAHTFIKVYTNQKEIELYQNGMLVDCVKCDKVAVFAVVLKKGENHFKVRTVSDTSVSDETTFIRKINAKSYKLVGKSSNSANWV